MDQTPGGTQRTDMRDPGDRPRDVFVTEVRSFVSEFTRLSGENIGERFAFAPSAALGVAFENGKLAFDAFPQIRLRRDGQPEGPHVVARVRVAETDQRTPDGFRGLEVKASSPREASEGSDLLQSRVELSRNQLTAIAADITEAAQNVWGDVPVSFDADGVITHSPGNDARGARSRGHGSDGAGGLLHRFFGNDGR